MRFGEIRLSGTAGTLPNGLITPSCSGTSCTIAIPDIGTHTFSLDEIYDPSLINDGSLTGYNAEVQSVTVANGVTLVQERSAARGDGGTPFTFQTYSGWTDNSVFGFGLLAVTENGTTTNRFTSYNFGSASGNNPSARGSETTSATWEGIAVGVTLDNFIHQGNVTIDIDDFNNPDVDVVISDWNGDRSNQGSGTSFQWQNMTLSNGAFSEEGVGDYLYLRGRFYGDNHEEVGGVFSDTNYHGAFGATRQ